MNLNEVGKLATYTFLSSVRFPRDSGQLHDNFFSKPIAAGENSISFPLMKNPDVKYGKILEVAPSIRYKIRRVSGFKGNRYTYKKHPNKHFRYIENIIEQDIIPMLENEYGVKKIWQQLNW